MNGLAMPFLANHPLRSHIRSIASGAHFAYADRFHNFGRRSLFRWATSGGGLCVLLASLVGLAVMPAGAQAQIQASTPLHVLQFSPAVVGAPQASEQTLTATFTVSGYTGTFTPTVDMHYKFDYMLGPITCIAGGSTETCSVNVTFIPQLPGGRKDAIFLMAGTTRIGKLLLYGIGQGPLSAIEPGVVTYATPLPPSHYFYGSTIDENGIIYALTNTYDTVYRIAKDGTVTTLDVVGARGINTIAIDGAGVLYLGCFSNSICTYDTVLGTVGSVPVPWTTSPNDFQETITVDGIGDLYSIEYAPNNGIIKELKADGTYTSTTLNPELLQPAQITTDATNDVFVGGYYINELTTAGVQTQVNTLGASEGVLVDASETLYATRYNGANRNLGVAELPPGGYVNANGYLDTVGEIGDPLGIGLGSDGTLGVGVYTNFDIVDRSYGSLTFQNPVVGVTSTLTSDVRNIGNAPLTIIDIVLVGDEFSLATGFGNCAANSVLAPAETCNIVVSLTPTHPGTFSGAVVVTTTYAPEVTHEQPIDLIGQVSGAYLTASPTSTNFGGVQTGTSSPAQTVTLTNTGIDFPARVTAIASSDPAFVVAPGNCRTQDVALNGTCQLTATFHPTAITHYSATITVTYVSDGGSQVGETAAFTVIGDGTGPPTPVVSLNPLALAFGSQFVSFPSSAQTATLSNTGNGPLTISSIVLGGPNPSAFAETTTCGPTLAAGAACQISATFTPAATGPLSAAITVTDNASGSPHQLTLSGTGITVPVATLSPASLNFGNQLDGSVSAGQNLLLSNPSSTTALNFDAISISGAGSASFNQTNNCGATIAASASCSISVTFDPAAIGALSATLAVATRYPTLGPVTVTSALMGTGVAPATPTFTPSTLAFGNQFVTTTSAPLSTTLTNIGTDTLVIDGAIPTIFGSGASAVLASSNCPATLAPAATCTVSATFFPATVGAYLLNMTMSAHYVSAPSIKLTPTATLTGTGINPPPIIAINPVSLSFGNVIQGSTSPAQTVTVTNIGQGSLSLSTISLAQNSPVVFSQTNDCSNLAILPGGSCRIAVTFSPTLTSSFSGTIEIDNSNGLPPQTVSLTGTGTTQPPLVLSLSPNAATVFRGASTSLVVNVQSLGGGVHNPVMLSVSGLPSGVTGTFTPASISAGTGTGSSTLTINASITAATSRPHPPLWPVGTSTLALAFLSISRRKRKLVYQKMLLILFALASVASVGSLSGCGFVSPITTSMVTITATSGPQVQTAAFTLTVE